MVKQIAFLVFAPMMKWNTTAGQAVFVFSGFEVIDWITKEAMVYNRKELLNNCFLAK